MCEDCGCNDTGERLHSPAREQLAAEAGAVFGTPPEVEAPEPIGETPEFGGLTFDDVEADATGAVLIGDEGQTLDADDPVFEPRAGESDEDAHTRYHEELGEDTDHGHDDHDEDDEPVAHDEEGEDDYGNPARARGEAWM